MSRVSGSNPRAQGMHPRGDGGAGGKRKHSGSALASLFKANPGTTAAGTIAADLSSLKNAEQGRANAEQRHAVDLAHAGHSFFLTGGAGTGKSFTLRLVVQALQAKNGFERVFVTASTGIAACHIGGTTLHSFGGIGLGKESAQDLLRNLQKKRGAIKRWHDCEVLVIDEVSMLDAALFDKLEQLARLVRHNERPFGGIQLILCGDFFQLPPVGLSNRPGIAFLFEAASWNRVVPQTVLLRTVIRQKDQTFVDLLNAMRRGRLSPFHVQLLKLHLARRHEPLQLLAMRESKAEQTAKAEQPHEQPAKPELEVEQTAKPELEAEHPATQPAEQPAAAATALGSAENPQQNPFADLAYGEAAAVPGPKRPARRPEIVTKLFPKNEPADHENRRRLAELPAQAYCYTANEMNGQQMEGCIAMSELNLKVCLCLSSCHLSS